MKRFNFLTLSTEEGHVTESGLSNATAFNSCCRCHRETLKLLTLVHNPATCSNQTQTTTTTTTFRIILMLDAMGMKRLIRCKITPTMTNKITTFNNGIFKLLTLHIAIWSPFGRTCLFVRWKEKCPKRRFSKVWRNESDLQRFYASIKLSTTLLYGAEILIALLKMKWPNMVTLELMCGMLGLTVYFTLPNC